MSMLLWSVYRRIEGINFRVKSQRTRHGAMKTNLSALLPYLTKII